MGDATRNYFLSVFEETLSILEQHDVPHLVVGSVANSAYLRVGWEPASDVDILVTKEDADRCLEIFPTYGYAKHIRDPSWIYKVGMPNMTIDIIFKASRIVELDDEMFSASTVQSFERFDIRVPSIEDMALLFVLLDTDERQGYWYDAMKYLRRIHDWDYLVKRGERYASRKLLSALLYAAESNIDVPERAIDALLAAT